MRELTINQFCPPCKTEQTHILKMDLPEKYIYQCDTCKKIIRINK